LSHRWSSFASLRIQPWFPGPLFILLVYKMIITPNAIRVSLTILHEIWHADNHSQRKDCNQNHGILENGHRRDCASCVSINHHKLAYLQSLHVVRSW
jgi:hypothetical protein